MGVRSSHRGQIDGQQDIIYQNLNHRVLISSGNHKPAPSNTVSNHSPLILDVYVRRPTIAVEQDAEKNTEYSLDFIFDAKSPCTITVFFFAQEVLDAGQVTQDYYYDHTRNLPPQTFTFDAGLGQKFPAKTVVLNISGMAENVLLTKDRKTYVFIIEIVGGMQRPTFPESGKRHAVTSLVTLAREGDIYKAKVVHQKFTSESDSFYVAEIFGIENKETNECVVCMTDRRDTCVFPCRHLCLCTKCAHTMRNQRQAKCPICRTPVQRLIQVKEE